nr:GGDEF domain-containing protein [bacterium]
MDLFFHVIIVLEMTLINLSTIYMYSRHKKSPAVTWAVLGASMAAVIIPMMLLLHFWPVYGNGNGLFILLSVVFIIPLKCLLDESLRYIVALACSCWIYTMFAFSLSVRICYLLPGQWSAGYACAIQTAFYLATLHVFQRFIRQKLVYILQNLQRATMNRLLGLSIITLIFCMLTNYVFVMESSDVLRLILVCVQMAVAIISYNLLYSLVAANCMADRLRASAQLDVLTGLKNRKCLYADGDAMIRQHTPFTLFFMDLDRLKTINDIHGHQAGDRYLMAFSKAISQPFARVGEAYRISGDEFIFLYRGQDAAAMQQHLSSLEVCVEDGLAFQGVSLGMARFPEDAQTLQELIACADARMYRHKGDRRMEDQHRWDAP